MTIDVLIEDAFDQKNIVGYNSTNLKIIEEHYQIELDMHGGEIKTNSQNEELNCKLKELFTVLLRISKMHNTITPRDITYALNLLDNNNLPKLMRLFENKKAIGHTHTNRPIFAKTLKQIEYIDYLDKKDLVISIGSAGTGKTYLAVVHAISLLKKGTFKKLILTRPAVEAGESLGYLPGDLKEKIDPYLRPLYDALYDMLGAAETQSLIEKQIIEIAPLAYMRGRTLENAYVILDEAQNTTTLQMKMFLTRMGFNSKLVITGDISQIDLPRGKMSGLVEAAHLLKGIDEIGIVKFENVDVVRHPLVAKILARYEMIENAQKI